MIEIDDAGGGCFLGPEVLVIHRLETNEAWYFLLIPPHVKERILFATRILKKAFIELGISCQEPVRLCRGEIFDLFEEYLKAKGYPVVREKVSAATDRLAEGKFLEILHSYGLPSDITLRDRNYREFYEWVSLWYHSLPKAKKHLCKVRLRPPVRTQVLVKKYPNLLRQIFTETSVS